MWQKCKNNLKIYRFRNSCSSLCSFIGSTRFSCWWLILSMRSHQWTKFLREREQSRRKKEEKGNLFVIPFKPCYLLRSVVQFLPIFPDKLRKERARIKWKTLIDWPVQFCREKGRIDCVWREIWRCNDVWLICTGKRMKIEGGDNRQFHSNFTC